MSTVVRPVDEAHALISAKRLAREPWQRDDETLARLREVDPAPQGFAAGDGAAIVRRTPQAVSVIQIAGDAASTGELLVAAGAVEPSYVAAMHARESSVSTHMGNRLAIPHGTNEAKSAITRSAISFVRYPGGVDWNGKPVTFVIGIAGQGDDHLALLRRIAEVFVDPDQVSLLEAARSTSDVMQVLGVVQPA